MCFKMCVLAGRGEWGLLNFKISASIFQIITQEVANQRLIYYWRARCCELPLVRWGPSLREERGNAAALALTSRGPHVGGPSASAEGGSAATRWAGSRRGASAPSVVSLELGRHWTRRQGGASKDSRSRSLPSGAGNLTERETSLRRLVRVALKAGPWDGGIRCHEEYQEKISTRGDLSSCWQQRWGSAGRVGEKRILILLAHEESNESSYSLETISFFYFSLWSASPQFRTVLVHWSDLSLIPIGRKLPAGFKQQGCPSLTSPQLGVSHALPWKTQRDFISVNFFVLQFTISLWDWVLQIQF